MRAARLVTVLAVVLAAVLALGSCQVLEFLFGSVFPSTVGLARAQTDLSAQIASGDGSAFKLRVVQSGGSGYVILIGSLQTGITAYVYSLDLSPVTTVTGLLSDGVMVDGSGSIVISTQLYSPATFAAAGTTNGNLIYANGSVGGVDGFFDSASLAPVSNFNIPNGSSVLNYNTYTPFPPWPAGSTARPPVTLSAVTSNLRVVSILDDGNASGNATLAFSQNSSGGNNSQGATCWFVTLPKSTWVTGAVSAFPMDSPSTPRLDNIDTESIGFAQGNLIIYDSKAGRFLRIDPATGSVQGSLYSGQDISNTRLGYLASGGFFYGFDTKTRVLTKYAAWW